MIYHIPLEEYQTRYTADWTRQFEDEFARKGIQFKTVKGESATVKTGTDPLDAVGTTIWKTTQLLKLEKMIGQGEVKDGDVFLFADIWFPGIQNLMYLRDMLGLKVRMYGVLHAGCYDKHDFTCRKGMCPWGLGFEKSILGGVDGVFVATEFHKFIIEAQHGKCPNLNVTGIPFYAKEVQKFAQQKDERLVLFPHRNAEEKHPELFDELARLLGSGYKCVKTMEVCRTREDYFDLMGRASWVVSFAEQETFGYSMLEALALGANVLVPDALSYRETMPWDARYSCSLEDAPKFASELILSGIHTSMPEYADRWSGAIGNMLDIITGGN